VTGREQINHPYLFDDFDGGALAMARRGARQQRPNRMNRLPVAPNDSADIALTQLNFKDCRFAARNFREHHLVGKFNQLANNELEKFFHEDQTIERFLVVELSQSMSLSS
jgi:hypothetical protein